MIRRGQIFIRAQDEAGKWGAADIFDLDEESFRRVIVSRLAEAGCFVMLKDEHVTAASSPLITTKRFLDEDD